MLGRSSMFSTRYCSPITPDPAIVNILGFTNMCSQSSSAPLHAIWHKESLSRGVYDFCAQSSNPGIPATPKIPILARFCLLLRDFLAIFTREPSLRCRPASIATPPGLPMSPLSLFFSEGPRPCLRPFPTDCSAHNPCPYPPLVTLRAPPRL